jgi:hypothetical protein
MNLYHTINRRFRLIATLPSPQLPRNWQRIRIPPLLLKPCHGPHASEPEARVDSRAWPKCKADTRMGRPRKQPNEPPRRFPPLVDVNIGIQFPLALIFIMEYCKLLSRCRERTIRQCPTNYVRQARNVERGGNCTGCLDMLAEKSLWW